MTSPVIIDTNVVVAGLISIDPASPVTRILDGMLAAAFTFVLSEKLLAEYHSVLVRPALRRRHRLTIDEVDRVLVAVARHAVVLRPGEGQPSPPAPDPGDQFLWDLLTVRPDLTLVTGDRLLLEDSGMAGRVIAPSTFVRDRHHSGRRP